MEQSNKKKPSVFPSIFGRVTNYTKTVFLLFTFIPSKKPPLLVKHGNWTMTQCTIF